MGRQRKEAVAVAGLRDGVVKGVKHENERGKPSSKIKVMSKPGLFLPANYAEHAYVHAYPNAAEYDTHKSSAQQLFDVLNPLQLLLFVTHHTQ